MPETHAVWSWDGKHSLWMEVARGSKRDMTDTLASKQRAAAKFLPSARFTMTSLKQPPTEGPGDE